MVHQPLLTYARLVLLLLACVMPCAPALAMPVVYTDRAAFDAAAGSYTLLTLGDPSSVDAPVNEVGVWHNFYNDLLVFGTGDNLTNCAPTMGCMGYDTFIAVIQPPVRLPVWIFGLELRPVTAFGFDYTVTDPSAYDPFRVAAAEFMGDEYILAKPGGFLGFISPIPFHASVGTGRSSDLEFSIDRVAIQAVPELSTWALLMLGSLAMILASWRTSRQSV